MTGVLTNTSGNTFSATIIGLTDGASYTYYIRCRDSVAAPNESLLQVNFSVASPSEPPPPPPPVSNDGTTIGTLTLTPTIENIGVISSFTGDENKNNSAVLEHREVGSAVWKPGIAMTVDRRDLLYVFRAGTTPNSYKNQWRAVIFWKTDQNANSVVEYGVTNNYGLSVSDEKLVVEHSIALSELLPNTVYHLQIKSQNSNKEEIKTKDYEFTTIGYPIENKATETAKQDFKLQQPSSKVLFIVQIVLILAAVALLICIIRVFRKHKI